MTGGTEIAIEGTSIDDFTAFVRTHEARLRQSLSAVFGSESGRDAAADALAYGWEHWDRIKAMENPVGYLYKVGRDRGRSYRPKPFPSFIFVDPRYEFDVEPRLPAALGRLPERNEQPSCWSIVSNGRCPRWPNILGYRRGLSRHISAAA